MLAAVLIATAPGWVTQMQSKYGVTPSNVAQAWEGIEASAGPYGTMGYYWHAPTRFDDNRGLGGGIAWAWDDDLCKEQSHTDGYDGHAIFESQFEENIAWAPNFISCRDIRAAMHRAFQTWGDMHQAIHFIDVTEECRRLYGKVESNCSLVEVFITHRTDDEVPEDAGRPWCADDNMCEGLPFPSDDPYQVISLPGEDPEGGKGGGGDEPDDYVYDEYRRRSLAQQQGGRPHETESYAAVAAASAAQYSRWAYDLRSTNGHVQTINGEGRQVIEVFGGKITFNVDKCWYLDSDFCAPLHALKAQLGAGNALALCQGIVFTLFAIGLFSAVLLLVGMCKKQKICFPDLSKVQCPLHSMQDVSKNIRRASISISTSMHDLTDINKDIDVAKKDIQTVNRSIRKKCDDILVEIKQWGVLPMTALLLSLWVPVSIQMNIFDPCWNCFDFEAAATHEVGHILGFGHPNSMSTHGGYPTGNNSHHVLLAAKDGTKSYATEGFPADACTNPWVYVREGAWDDGDLSDYGVRDTIMESFTEHNPRVCLTADDLEGLNVLYPICTGRDVTRTTHDWNCFKSKQRIGWVRTLIFVFVPIVVLMTFQMCLLSCGTRYEARQQRKRDRRDAKLAELAEQQKQQSMLHAEWHVENSAMLSQKLEQQLATEDERVEKRAEEMAALKIQARFRGNMVRHGSMRGSSEAVVAESSV